MQIPGQGTIVIQTPSLADQEKAAARLKSYTHAAVIVLVLYFLFYAPGLIANIWYLVEAKHDERLAGRSLPGVWILVGELIGGLLVLVGIIKFIYDISHFDTMFMS
jgi:hypothetical protein